MVSFFSTHYESRYRFKLVLRIRRRDSRPKNCLWVCTTLQTNWYTLRLFIRVDLQIICPFYETYLFFMLPSSVSFWQDDPIAGVQTTVEKSLCPRYCVAWVLQTRAALDPTGYGIFISSEVRFYSFKWWCFITWNSSLISSVCSKTVGTKHYTMHNKV